MKADHHILQLKMPYNLYCQLKIRAFEVGLGIYEMCQPETDAYFQSLIKLVTPTESRLDPKPILEVEEKLKEKVEIPVEQRVF